MPVRRIEIEMRPQVGDALASQTVARLRMWLDLRVAAIRTRRVLHVDAEIDDEEAERVLAALVDPVAEVGALGMLPDEFAQDAALGPPTFVTVGFRPGVTDAVGRTAKRAVEDCLGRPVSGAVYTSTLYVIWGCPAAQLESAAHEALHNPLIERLDVVSPPRTLDLRVPRAGSELPVRVETVVVSDADDATLARISRERLLALEPVEMRAIAEYFAQRGREPTDAELECLAQTWSEHCKHKIFAAPIDFEQPDGTVRTIERGLFATYVKATTELVAQNRLQGGLDPQAEPFLVSVFHDNAGVVRFTDADHLVYKVETHNSPSALDPYGGAMTGIVGVNRDTFGTGRGAELLTNVWGYCLADHEFADRVPTGLMHPRRIRDGVHAGVIDGGNHSGVPYSRGFELFDRGFLGKPLVFCGTVGVMPKERGGQPTEQKFVAAGDKVVMLGGRIGKDGIHGATFSSVQLDESAPVQAVQIGDPITQKMMFDLLTIARDEGLISGMTDNGAGGLSSSVGEMAELTGGARIDLAAAPLKYPGLAPWEILVSEAQERMTVAVPVANLAAFMALCRAREVEAAVLGEFTSTGTFEVVHAELQVVDLPLSFLHEGVPRIRRRARLAQEPAGSPAPAPPVPDAAELLQTLLARPNLRSGSLRAAAYDHEVKGLSVIKPFVGVRRDVPSTATVMRVRHHRREGVVLGEGIHPYFAEFDAYAMASAAVDEGVRRVLCAGARIDRLAALDNFCWPDPIESDTTPDGRHKLAQLVRCCEGLFDTCVGYGVPLISGKDSMKNDAVLDGVKISILPTLLVSVMGQMPDVSAALALGPRAPGDDVWLLGSTHAELGGSEALRVLGSRGGAVPRTATAANFEGYGRFVAARDAGLIRSAHVCSRGGLAVALAHLVLASEYGLRLQIERARAGLDVAAFLFSESTGRIVFTTHPSHRAELLACLPGGAATLVGGVTAQPRLRIDDGSRCELELELDALRRVFAPDEPAHG